jgi:hypothetical protein
LIGEYKRLADNLGLREFARDEERACWVFSLCVAPLRNQTLGVLFVHDMKLWTIQELSTWFLLSKMVLTRPAVCRS